MALDDLKETIETLRKRIQAHRAYLAGNETRTRQVLIDPMLGTLGWDVGNPDSVELEYSINQQRVDYALMGSEKPVAVIEAKALGKPLDEKETMQVLNYANTAGIPYMTLTNGDHWRMLEVFQQAPINERILMDFQLTQDEPYACALQALGLWRPNLASGEPKEAVTPVMIKLSHDESLPSPPKPKSEKEVAELSNNGDWEPLMSLTMKPDQGPLKNIRFPDLSQKPITVPVDILTHTVEYLVETGKLSVEDCPIVKKNSSLPLLDKTNERFRRSKKIGDDLWLNTSIKSPAANTYRDRAYWLLEKFGILPSTVLVSANQR